MSESARELGINEYVSVLRRRWRFVVAVPLAILLVVGGLSLSQQRVYEATAEVLILTDANEALFPITATTAERLRRNPFAEQQYLSSEVFRETVGADDSGLPSVSYELASPLADQDIADAGILVFRARAGTAAGAAATADEHATAYVVARHQLDVSQTKDQLEDLEVSLFRLQSQREADDARLTSLRTQLENAPSEAAQRQIEADIAVLEEERLVLDLAGRESETTNEIATLEQVSNDLDDTGAAARVHNRADEPNGPISPDVRRNLVFAAIAGLVLGAAAAIARDLLDGTADDPIELAEATGTPVLGAIRAKKELSDLTTLVDGTGCQTILNSLSLGSGSQIRRAIAVTSATASVGKTETVINLARVEASSGSTVLIIDGNPISPMIMSRLSPAARRDDDVDDPRGAQMRQTGEPSRSSFPRIDIIDLFTSGAVSTDLVRTGELERMLEKFEAQYDLILIDAPAVLSAVDVRPLVTKADAVIVVYVPGLSRVGDLERTTELLRGAGVPVAGLVANRAPKGSPGYQYTRTGVS